MKIKERHVELKKTKENLRKLKKINKDNQRN